MFRFRPTIGILTRVVALGVALALGAAFAIAGPAARAQEGDTPPFDVAAFDIALEPVAEGFDQPLHVADPGDGSGRLFVVEQAGRVRIVRDGEVAAEPFLDVAALIEAGGNEQGLLSIAFHPDYAANGTFFIGYTAADGGDNSVARYRVSTDDPDRADPASAEVLLAVEDPYGNHNGGLVAFGPDGYLYVGLGDGGSAGDPEGNGQDRATLLGSILRLDVDRAGDDTPYAIPADNPFVGDAAAAPEIWSYGLRNPWRFSFDRATGDLFIGDVGQGAIEEISYQPASSTGGENYGWNVMEGTTCFAADPCDASGDGLVLPVAEYSHDFGCSVTGGHVYRGEAQPALRGVYLFADYCTGFLWGLGRDAAGEWAMSEPIETGLSISSFGEDAAGEVYLTDLGGGLYRVAAGD